MKVSPNERHTARERKSDGRRAGGGGGARRRDRREQNSERRRGGDEGTWETCRVAFHQSQMLFSSFHAPPARESRRFSPSLPTSFSLLFDRSTRPTLKCFGRSSKLVPSCFSLYSSFFFPAFVSSPSARVSYHSLSFLPSFMFFRALSHLSAVSTSISKKSSRELFVGKCREPAVLRARTEIEVRKANEIKKNDVEERKKV